MEIEQNLKEQLMGLDQKARDELLVKFLLIAGISEENIKRIVVYLIDEWNASIYARNSIGYTSLILSLKQNYLDIAKDFIQRGVDVNDQENLEGYNALMAYTICCKEQDQQMTRLLIEQTKSLDAIDKEGNTALMLAITKHKLDIAEILIDKGANVNACTPNNHTPLLLAMANKFYTSDKTLSEKYENLIDKIYSKQEQQLFNSSINGNLECVNNLMKARADVNVQDEKGNTPLMLSLQNGHIEIASILLNRDTDTKCCLASQTHYSKDEAYGTLNRAIDVTLTNKQGKTALQIAQDKKDEIAHSDMDSSEKEEALKQYDMLINTIAQRQNEQLIAAVKDGNFDAVNRLYFAKADFNIKDGNDNDLLSIVRKNLSGNVDSFKKTAFMGIKKCIENRQKEQLKESYEKSSTENGVDFSALSVDDVAKYIGDIDNSKSSQTKSSTKKNKNKPKKKNNKKSNQQQEVATQATKPSVKDIDKSKTPDKKTKDSTAVVKNTTTISTTLSSINSVNQKPTTPTEKKTSTTVTAPVVDNVKSSTKTTATVKPIVSVKPTVAVKKEISSKQPEILQEKQKTQLKQKETQKTGTKPIKSKIIKNTPSIKNTEVLQGQQRPAKNLSDTEKNTTVSTMIPSNEKLAKQQEQLIPNIRQASTTQKTQPLESTVSTKQVQTSKTPTQQTENLQLSSSKNVQLKQGQKTQKTETTQPLAEPVVAAPTIQQGVAVLKENVSNFMEFKAENDGAERTKNGFILLSLLQQKEVGKAVNFVLQCNGIIDFNVFDRDAEDFPLQAAIRNKQRDFVDILSQQPIHTSNFGRVARFIASEYVDAYRRNDNDTARYYADMWNNIKEKYIGQQTIFGNNSSYIGKTIEFCRIVDSCFFKGEFDYKEITQAGIDLTRARTQAMQTMVDGDVKRILQQDNPESYNSNSIQMNSLNGNYSTVSTRPAMQPMPPMQPTPVMPAMQPIQPMQVMPARYPMQAMQQMPAMQSMRAVQSMPAMQPMQVMPAMPVMQQMRPMQPMQVMQQMPVIQPMPVAQPMQVMPAMQSMRVLQSMPAMQPRQVIQSTPAPIVRVNRNQGNQRSNGNGIGGL